MGFSKEELTFNTAAAMQQGADVPLDSTDTDQLVPDQVGVV